MRNKLAKIVITGIFVIASSLFAQFKPNISLRKLLERYTNGESKFLEINGQKVHYRDEGTGFPLVLLHGISSSLHTWEPWAQRLKSHFRIISIDLPGFGLTGPNKGHHYAQEDQEAFLDAFLDELDIRECHMAGNSMGGWITWWYALKNPYRVKKIILLNSLCYPMEKMPFVIRLAQMPVLRQLTKRITPKYLVKKSVKEVYYSHDMVTPEVVDRYYDLMLRKGNREAFVKCSNSDPSPNVSQIKNIQTPTLIMWGEKDNWIPVEHAYRLHKDIPESKLIVYKDVGHVPMEEIPMKSAADARAFLES